MTVDRVRFLEQSARARRAILLLLVAGTPIFFWRGFADPINMPKFGLLLIGVAIALGLRVAEGLQGPRSGWKGLSRLWIPAAALTVPLMIAWIFSPYKGWALLGAYTRYQGLIPYLLLALLGILLADAFRDRSDSLGWALTIAGAGVGAYALVQVVGWDPFEWSAREGLSEKITSTTGNSNFTGGFLAITIPVIAAMWWKFPARRSALGACLAVAILGWLFARSEGAWVAGLAGLSVAAGVFLRARSKVALIAGVTVAAVLTLSMVGVILWAANGSPGSQLVSRTVSVRGLWWQEAAAMGASSPIVGRGPNAYALEVFRHRIPAEVRSEVNISNDPHSVPLSLFAAAGAIGLLGFLAAAAWSFRTAVSPEGNDVLIAGFAGGATAYLVQSLVSLDELILRVGFWTCLAGLAVCALPKERGAPSKRRKRPVREPLRAIPAIGLVVVVTVATSVWGVRLLMADANVLAAERAFVLGDVDAAREGFASAVRLHSWDEYQRRYGGMLGQAAVAQGTDGAALKAEMDTVFTYLEDHLDYPGVITYGTRLEEWGEIAPESFEDALAQFRRALSVNPLDPFVRVRIADVLVKMDRAPEALEVIEEARELGSLYPEFWGSLAVVNATLGRDEAAREAIERGRLLKASGFRLLEAQEILDESQ